MVHILQEIPQSEVIKAELLNFQIDETFHTYDKRSTQWPRYCIEHNHYVPFPITYDPLDKDLVFDPVICLNCKSCFTVIPVEIYTSLDSFLQFLAYCPHCSIVWKPVEYQNCSEVNKRNYKRKVYEKNRCKI